MFSKTKIVISIFYNRCGWHHLISICILRLVKIRLVEEANAVYNLFLSRKRGDHITLVIICDKTLQEKVVFDFNEEVYGFLARFPSVSLGSEVPVNGVFMNFPNNTIRYNLYNLPNGKLDTKMKGIVSKDILTCLSESEIDDEALFTFCFYTHLVIIKAFAIKYGLDQIKCSLELLISNTKNQDDLTMAHESGIYADVLFNDNKEIFLEYYNEIFESDDISIKTSVIDWQGIIEESDDPSLASSFSTISKSLLEQFDCSGEKRFYWYIILITLRQSLSLVHQ
jgi:hypothetical protein